MKKRKTRNGLLAMTLTLAGTLLTSGFSLLAQRVRADDSGATANPSSQSKTVRQADKSPPKKKKRHRSGADRVIMEKGTGDNLPGSPTHK